MPSTRSLKKKTPQTENSDQEMLPAPATGSESRKCSASLQSYAASDEEKSVHSDSPVKHLKRYYNPSTNLNSPVAITEGSSARPRKLSFSSTHEETALEHAVEDPTAGISSKRSRRPTEKALYTSRDKQDNTASDGYRVVQKDQQIPAKIKVLQKSAGRVPPPPDSSHAPVIKSEPHDVDLSQFSSNPSMKVKERPAARFSSPIVISSSESDTSTPKARPAKSDKGPRSAIKLKHINFARAARSSDKAPSTPLHSNHTSGGRNHGTQPSIRDGSNDPASLSVEESDDLPASARPLSRKAGELTIKARKLEFDSPSSVRPSSSSAPTVYLEDIAPTIVKPSFTVVPFDNANGPATCPAHLLHTSDDGSVSPIELVAGAFDLFEGAPFKSIISALQFEELRPFVNVTRVPRPRIYAEKFKNHVMWSGQNRSVIFTMLGSVQACNLIEPTAFGQHLCKAITIIPFGEAWRKFQVFMGELYGHGQMRGPFDHGCLLTLSGRREGYSLDVFGSSIPVTPKKNMRAFGSSGTTASSEWYDSKLPNCIDFDKPIPIYDASKKAFLFGREDFVGMPTLPLYKKSGKISDLPVDSIVSVFFAMSSYTKKVPGSSSTTSSSGASFNDVLSLNIHFVIFYGVIPRED